MSERKTYSREFKREAVRQLELGEKPASVLARELGVARNKLYRWKEAVDRLGEDAFPGHGGRRSAKPGKDNALSNENVRLKKELAAAREENEILKKAAAFFARELK